MRLGIVGVGVVGAAVETGFRALGHRTSVHDIRLGTTISEVLDTEIVYICVPTPTGPDGACDTSVVRSVAGELAANDYRGIIAVKSTVEPGVTASLIEEYPERRFAHVPEFLRSRVSVEDFTTGHDVCVIGTDDPGDYETVRKSFGHYPKHFVHLSPTEAELAKYFNNLYNAMLVVFANDFEAVCRSFADRGADYTRIKNAMILRRHIYDRYLECNEQLRGFHHGCLPKDVRAFAALARKAAPGVRLFDAILEDNDRYP